MMHRSRYFGVVKVVVSRDVRKKGQKQDLGRKRAARQTPNVRLAKQKRGEWEFFQLLPLARKERAEERHSNAFNKSEMGIIRRGRRSEPSNFLAPRNREVRFCFLLPNLKASLLVVPYPVTNTQEPFRPFLPVCRFAICQRE